MGARWLRWLAVLVVVAAPTLGADDRPSKGPPTVQELLQRLRGPNAVREHEAVGALVRRKEEDVVPAALAQLKDETDFHARIALAYVLAAHGEKAGLEVLVASLEQTGHLGYVYLTRLAPDDLGWNRDGSSLAVWRAWLDGFSADEYRERVRRERMSPADLDAGSDEYQGAIDALRSGEPRTEVAARLRAYASAFPLAYPVSEARELASRLDEEAKEDAAWVEPASPATLSPDARTAWLVHHLRDATGTYLPFDGYTTFLPRRGPDASPAAGVVAELLAAGRASLPLLLRLLEDRRPVRAAGRGMRQVETHRWTSVPIVLRYQDVALELVNALLPPPTYDRPRSADYLSDAGPADRARLIDDVRRWAQETATSTPAELRWVAVRRSGTVDALSRLRWLAVDETQGPAVRAELHRMFAGGRPAIFRPLICEVMSDLGDTSKVAVVLEALEAGAYSMQRVTEDGDRDAGSKAEAAAQRIRAKYGKAAGAAPGPK